MKKKTLFLLVPLTVAALAACSGGSNANWSKISYEDAYKIGEKIGTNLGDFNKKANRVTISGNVDKLKFNGAVKIKTAGIEIGSDDVAINMSKQKIADVALDLTAIRATDEDDVNEILYYLAFPFSHHLVKFLDGVKEVPVAYYYDKNFDWTTVEHKKWTAIDTTFSSNKVGDKERLKADIKVNNFMNAYNEICKAIGEPDDDTFKEDTQISLSASVTTNEWGYLDSLSLNINAPEIHYLDESSYPDFTSINASLYASVNLSFKYGYVSTRTIQYQVGEYKNGKLDKLSDIKSAGDFTSYFIAEWYNYNCPNPYLQPEDKEEVEIDAYDNPIFNLYYWIKRSRSIALTDESYCLNIIPTYDPIETAHTYIPHYKLLEDKCMVTIDSKPYKVEKSVEFGTEDYARVIGDDYIVANDIGYVYISADYINSLSEDSKVVVYIALESTQSQPE